MIDREDMVFATCYQLASAIVEDWENIPSNIAGALEELEDVDEPGESLRCGFFTINPQFLDLSPSESEPTSFKNRRTIAEARVVIEIFELVLKDASSWNTAQSDDFKKEMRKRISDYTSIITKLTTTSPFSSVIKL